jgi:AGZA family xanthine/uracil permease-like MFS transporter
MTEPNAPDPKPAAADAPAPARWFVARDLDGFFGLALDNLVQLLTIIVLCGPGGAGLPAELLYGRILPAAAVSILLGNLFYARQAMQLAAATGRNDVTALPYGINTPSLIVYVFFVIRPEYDAVFRQTNDAAAAANAAWRLGCAACLGSGLIEFAGAFVAERIRRATPRAALLSTLAGIAIGFIAMTFALDMWAHPLVALPALAVILVTYFARVKFPGGLPGGLAAVLLGTAIAWSTGFMKPEAVRASTAELGLRLPVWSAGEILTAELFADLFRYAAVIVPMGLFNVIGSLQNIESAEAAGDSYPTMPSLAVNGLGSLAAALFGSPFPTTIYIGHPGWKGLGARAGYSTLNGVVITALCLTGAVSLVNAVVPVQAGYAIVLWIGIIITAQAFSAVPAAHAPAVAVGLFPSLAAWGMVVMQGAFLAGSTTSLEAMIRAGQANPGAGQVNGFSVHGLIVLERGYIFTSMILAAMSASLIDRRFAAAALWAAGGAVFTFVGFMHAYAIRFGNVVDYLFRFVAAPEGALVFRADGIAIGYAVAAALFAGLHRLQQQGKLETVDEAV